MLNKSERGGGDGGRSSPIKLNMSESLPVQCSEMKMSGFPIVEGGGVGRGMVRELTDMQDFEVVEGIMQRVVS